MLHAAMQMSAPTQALVDRELSATGQHVNTDSLVDEENAFTAVVRPSSRNMNSSVFWSNSSMFKQSDFFILMAVAVSFAVSGYLWFNGNQSEGLFTAIWVPSILAFGLYFELSAFAAKEE